MKRICLFSHYDRHDVVDPYVLRLLAALSRHVDQIIAVSHSNLDQHNKNKLLQYAQKVICEDNVGYDFGSWRSGYQACDVDKLSTFDELLLVNDSCYGPITSFDGLFQKMDQIQCDFWGMTDHGYEGGKGTAQYHLQSYFLAFKKPVFLSNTFRQHLFKKTSTANMSRFILKTEVSFYKKLRAAGFTPAVFFAEKIEPEKYHALMSNSSIYSPMPLLEAGCPLLKRKCFEYAPNELRPHIFDYVKQRNPELASEIRNHLNRVLPPQQHLITLNKTKIVPTSEIDWDTCGNIKLAIHLHLYYEEMKAEFADYLANIPVAFDLYITVVSAEIAELVQAYFLNCKQIKINNLYVKRIPNRGRNVSALIIPFAKALQKYDLVCHVHSKMKSAEMLPYYWRKYLFRNLLGSKAIIASILNEFFKNKNMGLIFPPPWTHILAVNKDLWANNKKQLKHILKLIGKDKIVLDQFAPIAPFGCMFWFRPQALASLFNYGFDYDDFEKEPIADDNTLLHVLERIFVYLALNDGYDFCYTIEKNDLLNGYSCLESMYFQSLVDIKNIKIGMCSTKWAFKTFIVAFARSIWFRSLGLVKIVFPKLFADRLEV